MSAVEFQLLLAYCCGVFSGVAVAVVLITGRNPLARARPAQVTPEASNSKTIASKATVPTNRGGQSGNVFILLFGAIGLVGVLGAATMTVLKGPVTTMSQVTKRTIAENNMIAAGKLALIAASSSQPDDGDCDADMTVEPVPFGQPLAGFTGGGTLPATIGVADQDSWGTPYGYCVWDHGSAIDAGGCAGANRLAGAPGDTEIVLAIISAGPDKIFQTTCNAYDGTTPLVDKAGGADDLVLSYTYGEATNLAAGLWGLADATTAEIGKSLSVKGGDDVERFAFDADAGDLTIANAGNIPSVRTDYLLSLANPTIDILSPFSASSGTIQMQSHLTATGNITTSANVNSGNLNASGTVTGAALASTGTLGVSGFSTLGDLSAGAATVDTLGVAGATALGTTLSVGGSATFSNALGVTGATNLTTLATSGLATLDSLAVTGGADIDGALTVDGLSSLAGLSADATTLQSLTVTGASSLNGGLTMGGSGIANLAAPVSNSDAATKAYVDANVAAGTGFTESDPQVGTLEGGKWCQSDGTTVECTSNAPVGAETDPQVGTLDGGKWCQANAGGTAITCTADAPSGGGSGAGYAAEMHVTAATPTIEFNSIPDGVTTLMLYTSGLTGSVESGELCLQLGQNGTYDTGAADYWYYNNQGQGTENNDDSHFCIYIQDSVGTRGVTNTKILLSDGIRYRSAIQTNGAENSGNVQDGVGGFNSIKAHNSVRLLTGEGDDFTQGYAKLVAVGGGGAGDGDTLADLSCGDGEIPKWNQTAGAWECAADDAGSGGGSGSGIYGTVDSSGTCIDCAGATAALNFGGTYSVTFDSPQPDANYTVLLSASGANGRFINYQNLTTAGFDVLIRNTGNTLTNEAWSFEVVSGNGSRAGDGDTLADLSCATNEIAKWNGSAWACAADETGSGAGGGGGSACAGGTNPQVHNGHCYTSFVTRADIAATDARAVCLSWGGELVSYNSAAEHAWVYGTYVSSSGHNGATWIGYSDGTQLPYGGTEGTFAWADGSTDYLPPVASNSGSEDCVWHDNSPDQLVARICSNALDYFVCESQTNVSAADNVLMCGEHFDREVIYESVGSCSGTNNWRQCLAGQELLIASFSFDTCDSGGGGG